MTIFPKLVITFLIVIIPIDALSLFMNVSGERIVRNELLASSASNVHFYLSALETEIERIMQLEREYISSDDDFKKAGVIPESMDDYERVETIRRIENKLSILKSSSPYIQEIKIYFPKLGHTILSGGLGEDTIPKEELDEIVHHAQHSASPLTYWNGRLFLGMVYPAPGNNMDFALEVELSLPLLKKSLAQMANNAASDTILINEKENWTVSGKQEHAILTDIMDFLRNTSAAGPQSGQQRMKLENEQYLLYYERSSMLGLTLVHYVPEKEATGVLNRYRTWYWILVLLSLGVVLLFSYWIFRLIHQPMRRLVGALRKVGEGNLTLRLHHRSRDEFQDVYHQFNTMVSRIQTLIDEVFEQKLRSQRSEMKQLQSQINPHFLYNSLFILLTLIKQQRLSHAEELVKHMGNYFRFITRNGEDEIRLDQEIQHAKAYAGIQSVRFPSIEVIWRGFPAASSELVVPRLILQPLIENAYLHGLEGKDGRGTLLVEAHAGDNRLEVVIEDDGDGLEDAVIDKLSAELRAAQDKNEWTGIFNVHRRLQLKFGSEYGLKVKRGALGGLAVSMTIPLPEEEHDV